MYPARVLAFPGAHIGHVLCRHVFIPPRLMDYVLYVILISQVIDGVPGARRSYNECSEECYQ